MIDTDKIRYGVEQAKRVRRDGLMIVEVGLLIKLADEIDRLRTRDNVIKFALRGAPNAEREPPDAA